ncbi:cupin domain-containing protein [Tepidibacter sp. Z1-5]|uniref:cupin domain-containing protein n=1 Tax=Tepidibacter sp. Z1-5 TaxID=3134138 RepID=UPI0030C14522
MSNKYEHLIMKDIEWTKSLPDHEGSIGDKGFPILMSNEFVPEAKAWVCPALLRADKKTSEAIANGSFGKATPHIHDGDEMYLILGEENSSTIAVTLGDDYYEVTTPAAVYIPAGLPHSIEAKRIDEGKFGGACPIFLGTEYITKPVPENPLKIENTEKLVMKDIEWVKSLPDHEGSIGDKGFPILMSNEFVPEAKAWVCPALLTADKKTSEAIANGSFGKATPHIHDGDEMYLLVGDENSSTMAVTLGGEYYEVTTPAAVYIPAGLPHSIEAKRIDEGKFGGACPIFLGTEYITKPVPEK